MDKNPLTMIHSIFFLLLLLTLDASASLGPISLDELTDRADLIVYGTIASIESSVIEKETPESKSKAQISIVSVQITPNKILKGSALDPLVVKATQNMEDDPKFLQNKDVFLFLTLNTDGSSYSIIGLIQGKFDVSDGWVVREQTSVDLFIKKLERLINID